MKWAAASPSFQSPMLCEFFLREIRTHAAGKVEYGKYYDGTDEFS